jgi:hypothetical protein
MTEFRLWSTDHIAALALIGVLGLLIVLLSRRMRQSCNDRIGHFLGAFLDDEFGRKLLLRLIFHLRRNKIGARHPFCEVAPADRTYLDFVRAGRTIINLA